MNLTQSAWRGRSTSLYVLSRDGTDRPGELENGFAPDPISPGYDPQPWKRQRRLRRYQMVTFSRDSRV